MIRRRAMMIRTVASHRRIILDSDDFQSSSYFTVNPAGPAVGPEHCSHHRIIIAVPRPGAGVSGPVTDHLEGNQYGCEEVFPKTAQSSLSFP